LAMRLIPSSMFKIALTLLAAAIIVVAGCATHHDGPCPFELSVFAPAGHSVSGTFMLCFSLTNVSTAAINPMIAKSTLKVNGKELAGWPVTIGNGPRDSRWEQLPPGDHMDFCFAVGPPDFTPHGVYDVVWIVQRCASRPFRIEVN